MTERKPLGELIRPMPGKIAIKIDVKAETTSGGIVLPRDVTRSVHEERPTTGVIVALGDEPTEEDLEESLGLRIGDVVLFGKYSGVKIIYQDPDDRNLREEVVVLDEKSILAVLKDETMASDIKVKS